MIGDCDTVDSRERCICVPERQVHDYATFFTLDLRPTTPHSNRTYVANELPYMNDNVVMRWNTDHQFYINGGIL